MLRGGGGRFSLNFCQIHMQQQSQMKDFGFWWFFCFFFQTDFDDDFDAALQMSKIKKSHQGVFRVAVHGGGGAWQNGVKINLLSVG